MSRTPLEKLQGEVTFGTNSIHRIFPLTEWRPTYYVRTEPPFLDMTEAELYSDRELTSEYQRWFIEPTLEMVETTQCFLPKWKKELGFEEHPNVTWINTCHNYKYNPANRPQKIHKHWHLPFYCDYGTVVNTAVQIAHQEFGFDEVYLLGCDLGHDGGQAHFYEDDWERNRIDRLPPEVEVENLINAHKIMRDNFPGKIYNATLGGELEVHERVDLDAVLCSR